MIRTWLKRSRCFTQAFRELLYCPSPAMASADSESQALAAVAPPTSATLRAREASGDTPERPVRSRVLAWGLEPAYQAYDAELVEKALDAGCEPWEGNLCVVCNSFTVPGEVCCAPVTPAVDPSPDVIETFVDMAPTQVYPADTPALEDQLKITEMLDLLRAHDEEADFVAALEAKGYSVHILEHWACILPEEYGGSETIAFDKIEKLTAACNAVIDKAIQDRLDSEPVAEILPPPDRTEEVTAKFQRLHGVAELLMCTATGKKVSRGAIQGKPGEVNAQTLDSWVQACGLEEKFDANVDFRDVKSFRKWNFLVFTTTTPVRDFLETFVDGAKAYGKQDAIRVVRLSPDSLLVAYFKKDQRAIQLPMAYARRFTFSPSARPAIQVPTFVSLGVLGWEYMGNIHVTDIDVAPVVDVIANLNALTSTELHRARCNATLTKAQSREDGQKLLLNNLGDLKALRQGEKLYTDGVLHSAKEGLHRRLVDYAAVQPGEYAALNALPMEWLKWDVAEKKWVPSSAQEYLAKGLHIQRCLVIQGPGGWGKTEFGKAVASELTELYQPKYGNESWSFGMAKVKCEFHGSLFVRIIVQTACHARAIRGPSVPARHDVITQVGQTVHEVAEWYADGMWLARGQYADGKSMAWSTRNKQDLSCLGGSHEHYPNQVYGGGYYIGRQHAPPLLVAVGRCSSGPIAHQENCVAPVLEESRRARSGPAACLPPRLGRWSGASPKRAHPDLHHQ